MTPIPNTCVFVIDKHCTSSCDCYWFSTVCISGSTWFGCLHRSHLHTIDLNAFWSCSYLNPYKTGFIREFTNDKNIHMFHTITISFELIIWDKNVSMKYQIAPGNTRMKKAVVTIARVLVTFLWAWCSCWAGPCIPCSSRFLAPCLRLARIRMYIQIVAPTGTRNTIIDKMPKMVLPALSFNEQLSGWYRMIINTVRGKCTMGGITQTASNNRVIFLLVK